MASIQANTLFANIGFNIKINPIIESSIPRTRKVLALKAIKSLFLKYKQIKWIPFKIAADPIMYPSTVKVAVGFVKVNTEHIINKIPKINSIALLLFIIRPPW